MRSASLRSAETTDEIDVHRALRMLRRRKAVVIGTTALVVAAAVLVTLLRSAQYEATAEVLLRRPSAVASGVDDATDPARAIQNEIRFIESDVTRERVAERLGRTVSIDVSAGSSDDLLSFTASEADPGDAAAVANAYAQAYLDLRTDELTADAEAVQRQIEGIDQRLAELPRPAPADASAPELDPAITEERTRLADQRAEAQSTLLAVQARLAGAGDRPRLVTPAEPPAGAQSSGLVRNLFVSIVIGSLLGCLLAAIAELLDRRIHDELDVERASGLATLATVNIGRPGRANSTAIESFRALHFWLYPPGAEGWPQVVAIIPVAGNGAASEIAAGLGAASASGGRRVLLVAFDLHGSRLPRVLGVSGEVGLASVLAAAVPIGEAVQSVPGHPGLCVIVAGTPVGDDPFAAGPLSELVERLRGDAGVVILEAPPAAGGADGLALAAIADATVLTVLEGTRSEALRQAVADLERGGAAVRGTVFVRGGRKRRRRPVHKPSPEAVSARRMSPQAASASQGPAPTVDESPPSPETDRGQPSNRPALH